MIVFPYIFITLVFIAVVFSRDFCTKRTNGTSRTNSQSQYRSNYYRGYYLIVSFALLLFFHIFKEPYSLPDLDQYISGFNSVVKQTWGQLAKSGFKIDLKAEFGWVILNKIIAVFTDNSFYLFLVTSVLILLGPYKTIRKYCPLQYLWVAVLLYFAGSYLQSLFVLRQHLSISICLLSIPSILKGDWKRYMLYCFMAFSFHYSAIMWFPVYSIYQIKSKKALLFTLVLLSLLIILAYSFILPLVALYLDFGYASWVSKDDMSGAKITESIMIGIVLFSYFLSAGKDIFDNGSQKLFSILLILAFVFSIAGIGYPQSGRLNMYYTRLVYIFIPISLSMQKNTIIRFILGSVMIATFLSVWIRHAFDASIDYNGYQLMF